MTKLIGRFWTIVLSAAIIFSLVKWGIPWGSREITTLPFLLPVPGALMFIYMALTLIAIFLFITFSDEIMDEFLAPIKKFLRGEYSKILRMIGLIAIPLLAGWQVYAITVPKLELPVSLRIQHPSSNFPKKFETMNNPFSNPAETDVQAFIDQAKAGDIKLIQQVMPDVEHWEEENEEDSPRLSFIPSAPIKKFLAELESGNVAAETAKAALIEKNLFEGRALYAMNCRPCHGDSVAGDGPMADGFKLRPINFTDNGTIETIVEGYTFWRVSNGGAGLPVEATPWDSAMPVWKLNLTEEERWKIIMAEYNLAEKTPRIPESH
ncbi:MAG: cytochrome c [Gammaproteobacteria bacterium]|nr:cytochrome c [Gammaproteobacteria bacterium]